MISSIAVTTTYSEVAEQKIQISLEEIKKILVNHFRNNPHGMVNKDCLSGEASVEIDEIDDHNFSQQVIVLKLKKTKEK